MPKRLWNKTGDIPWLRMDNAMQYRRWMQPTDLSIDVVEANEVMGI